jgi:hypothetical protein
MRLFSAAFLVSFSVPLLASAASPFWDSLTPTEQEKVLAGEIVTHVVDQNSVMGEASFVWVKRLSKTATPEGAAAVYWDFNGQPAFLAPAGVQSYVEVAPFGLSSKNVDAVIAIPGLPPIPYTAEVTAYRVGQKQFSIRWHVPKYDVQPAPGLRETHGSVDVESFPGDGGGALLVHQATAILAPEVANDQGYKDTTLNFHIYLTSLLKTRFEQGASLVQLLKFKSAILPW